MVITKSLSERITPPLLPAANEFRTADNTQQHSTLLIELAAVARFAVGVQVRQPALGRLPDCADLRPIEDEKRAEAGPSQRTMKHHTQARAHQNTKNVIISTTATTSEETIKPIARMMSEVNMML